MSVAARRAVTSLPSINLYCAGCEAQIGIFNNEWIRLTASYARSKDPGTHFGTEFGEKTQVVPAGASQKAAEGCTMSEVYCIKCMAVVGQYCTSAPNEEKQKLVDQHFYKLSRTILKDSRTFEKVDPIYGYAGEISPGSIKVSHTPRASLPPRPRWSETPVRQSKTVIGQSAPSVLSPLSALAPRTAQRATPSSARATTDTSSLRYNIVQDDNPDALDDLPTTLADKSVNVEGRAVQAADKTQEHEKQLAGLDKVLNAHDKKILEHNRRLNAQGFQIGEHKLKFVNQGNKIDGLTSQIAKLNETMDEMKATIQALQAERYQPAQLSQEDFIGHFESLLRGVRGGNSESEELRKLREEKDAEGLEVKRLRAENKKINARLRTITSTTSTTSGNAPDDTTLNDQAQDPLGSPELSAAVLGKRKRNPRGVGSARSKQRPKQTSTSRPRRGSTHEQESSPVPGDEVQQSITDAQLDPANGAAESGGDQAPQRLALGKSLSPVTGLPDDNNHMEDTEDFFQNIIGPVADDSTEAAATQMPRDNRGPNSQNTAEPLEFSDDENIAAPTSGNKGDPAITTTQDANESSSPHATRSRNRRRVTHTPAVQVEHHTSSETTNRRKTMPAQLQSDPVVEDSDGEYDAHRPRKKPYQSKTRRLEKELEMLGLFEWIGKDKRNSDYLKAVREARARFYKTDEQPQPQSLPQVLSDAPNVVQRPQKGKKGRKTDKAARKADKVTTVGEVALDSSGEYVE